MKQKQAAFQGGLFLFHIILSCTEKIIYIRKRGVSRTNLFYKKDYDVKIKMPRENIAGQYM